MAELFAVIRKVRQRIVDLARQQIKVRQRIVDLARQQILAIIQPRCRCFHTVDTTNFRSSFKIASA